MTGNSAYEGGGAYECTLYNCIVYFNTAQYGSNYDTNSSLDHCCTTPVPTTGVGNISLDPELASASHLSASSPCRAAGCASYATGTDVDGKPRGNPPSIGCDEYRAESVTGPLTVAVVVNYTNVTVGYPVALKALIGGRTTDSVWAFGDGDVAINQPYVMHEWTEPGDYLVALWAFNETHWDGVSATATIHVARQPVLYVAATSTNPQPPYANWTTAASNIQDAVNAAPQGEGLVLVADGVYAGGLAIEKPLTVRAMNGPQFTAIDGGGTNRCASLTEGASLSGFTLTNGYADKDVGGGVSCTSPNASLTNCLITGSCAGHGGGANGGSLYNCTLSGNRAEGYWVMEDFSVIYNVLGEGGGACSCTVYNCTLRDNTSSDEGGGAARCPLYNCTLAGNSAADGGGAFGCTLYNCILYYNAASGGANYDTSSILNYCCTTPLPVGGTGNISLDPQLASDSHLSAGSPCRGAGNAAYTTGTDIDGEPWGNPPSIGCDEYRPGAVTGPLTVSLLASYTNVAVGFPVALTALIAGRTTESVWEFGDGDVAINQPYVSHSWRVPGDYVVALWAFNESLPAGVSAQVVVRVQQGVHYVAAESPNSQPPYTSWATAATNIQAALDAAILPGESVVVTNGVYAGRVGVDKPVAVRSVNGAQFTVINGGGTNQCVSLTNGASLSGFTLTNGMAYSGAGASGGTLSNCTLAGNLVTDYAGGAYGSTLYNCTLTGNSAERGGGACWSTLYNCTLTGNWASYECGGAEYCYLYNCTLTGNPGGEAGDCTLYNCTVAGNTDGGVGGCVLFNCTLTGNAGGGAWSSTLYNCTVAGNPGGGAWSSTLYNCILYYNAASGEANYDPHCTLNYCCTAPLPSNGVGNITNAPLFVDHANGNLRLQSTSPCINAGNNSYLTGDLWSWDYYYSFTNSFDLDNHARVMSGTVDIGAYEYQGGGSVISYAWLQQYGLPADGSGDYADSDHDGMNNWQEWRCQTDPTDPLSALRLLSASCTGANVTVTWQSVAGLTYFVECSTNLSASPRFTLLAPNLLGQPGMATSFTHTNAGSFGLLFYRVGVSPP